MFLGGGKTARSHVTYLLLIIPHVKPEQGNFKS